MLPAVALSWGRKNQYNTPVLILALLCGVALNNVLSSLRSILTLCETRVIVVPTSKGLGEHSKALAVDVTVTLRKERSMFALPGLNQCKIWFDSLYDLLEPCLLVLISMSKHGDIDGLCSLRRYGLILGFFAIHYKP